MTLSNRRILVTGASGFIGKNLVVRLKELNSIGLTTFVRGDDATNLPHLVSQADAVVHLAGENRPSDEAFFAQINSGLTSAVCDSILQEFRSTGRQVVLLLASSTQAECDNPYGRSKLAAEAAVKALAKEVGNPSVIFRLPGVFGKWCKPNYNSVVATFCHNISRDLPIRIDDPTARLRLVYVDDVVNAMLSALEDPPTGCAWALVEPEYTVTLRELVEQIHAFGDCRTTLITERVGTGFTRALYATYVSHLPNEKF